MRIVQTLNVPEVLEQPVKELSLHPLVLHGWKPISDEDFERLCVSNPVLRLERSSEGDLIIMTPESGSGGAGNTRLLAALWLWAEKNGGEAFGASAGFILANKAIRSPDASWVSPERLEKLTQKDWQGFLPICPDFVIELLSKSDSRPFALAKMEEYIDQGARLGWLIDPFRKEVHVYQPGVEPELIRNPTSLSGEPVLPGFLLDIQKVWDAIERRGPSK